MFHSSQKPLDHTTPEYFSTSITTADLHPNAHSGLLDVPSELLVIILSHLPSSSHRCVSQTSQHLRTFLYNNAPAICNTAIRTYWSKHATLLDSQLQNGWLVPGDEIFIWAEERYLKEWNIKFHDPRITLREPGPQYRHFLEMFGTGLCTHWPVELEPGLRPGQGAGPDKKSEMKQRIYSNFLSPYLERVNRFVDEDEVLRFWPYRKPFSRLGNKWRRELGWWFGNSQLRFHSMVLGYIDKME